MSCLLAKLAIMYYIQHSRYNNSRMFLLLTNTGSACSFLKYWGPIVEKVKSKGLQVINVKYTWAFRPIKVEAQSVQTAKNWNFGCLVLGSKPPTPTSVQTSKQKLLLAFPHYLPWSWFLKAYLLKPIKLLVFVRKKRFWLFVFVSECVQRKWKWMTNGSSAQKNWISLKEKLFSRLLNATANPFLILLHTR